MKVKSKEFITKHQPNLHVISLTSQKKFKKLTHKKSLQSTAGRKNPVLKESQALKKEELKKKLKTKPKRIPVMNSPLVICMPSTSQTSVPDLLSGETTEPQQAAHCNISDLMTPKCSRSKSELQGIKKRSKEIKRTKKIKKSKFKVEDVESSDKIPLSNAPTSEFNSQPDNSSSAVESIDPRAKFYELDDTRVLLTIQQSCSIYFCGILTVSVLSGAVEILGFTVEPNGREYTVFSPKGSSLLCLSSVKSADDKNPTVTDLVTLGMKMSAANEVLNESANDTVFAVLKKGMTQALSSKFMYFVERYCRYSLFSDITSKGQPLLVAEKILNCSLYNCTNNAVRKEFTVIPKWLQIKEDLLKFSESNPKIVLCGGKAVGKSTLLRYFVNAMLQKYKKVVVLDCDIGQSEFTIPGCVSVVVVKEPLLGPSYTHFIKPKRCIFLGEISVMQCPEKYFKSIQFIFDYCNSKEEFKDLPWFVNTMGFNKGFGVMLTSCLIQRFGPTHLVQINSMDSKRNFPSWLTKDVVDHQYTGVFTAPYKPLDYKFYIVQSGAEYQDRPSKNLWGLQAPVARDVSILSYVAQMINPPAVDINEVIPNEVSISDINFELTEETQTREQMISAVNGSLVALCQTVDDINLCLGFGVVRGTDMQRGKVYVISPLSLDELKEVKTFVKSGHVALPETVYLDQGNNISGPVPYVSITSGRIPTRIPKKEYRPLNENLGTHIKDY